MPRFICGVPTMSLHSNSNLTPLTVHRQHRSVVVLRHRLLRWTFLQLVGHSGSSSSSSTRWESSCGCTIIYHPSMLLLILSFWRPKMPTSQVNQFQRWWGLATVLIKRTLILQRRMKETLYLLYIDLHHWFSKYPSNRRYARNNH